MSIMKGLVFIWYVAQMRYTDVGYFILITKKAIFYYHIKVCTVYCENQTQNKILCLGKISQQIKSTFVIKF